MDSDSQSCKAEMNRREFHRSLTVSTLAAAFTAASARRIMGANERLQVGIIGCGGRAGAHIHNLLAIKENDKILEIVAVCDTYRPRLQRAAKATGAAFTTMRHEELVAQKEVDVVLVATPDHWHGFHTLDAMRAGKDVYCEKPLSHWRQLNLPVQLVKTAKETKRIIQVGCQRMSCSAYQQARKLIADGAIGKPILAETGYYRIGDWGERGMPIDDPNAKPGPDLDWERFQGDSPKRDFDVSRYFRWRMYWDYSGGPGTDNYVHFYTPLSYMLNLGYPDTVTASGGKYRYEEREVPDTFNLIVDYPDKFVVICTGTQGNDYQSQGSGDNPIIRGWDATLTLEGNDIVIRPTGGSTKKEQRIPITSDTSELVFWREFLECCRTRQQPKSDIQLGSVVATTLQMAITAMREKRVMKFDQISQKVIG